MTTATSTDTTVTTTATGLQDGDVNIIVDDLTDEQEESMPCPVCNELIPAYALELHATVCAERTFDNHQTNNYHNTLNDVIFID
jgi:cytidine deaminase